MRALIAVGEEEEELPPTQGTLCDANSAAMQDRGATDVNDKHATDACVAATGVLR